MEQVLDQIRRNGTYELAYNELQYGARLAWRNAPKCSNRKVHRSFLPTLYCSSQNPLPVWCTECTWCLRLCCVHLQFWNELKLFDKRNVTTNQVGKTV